MNRNIHPRTQGCTKCKEHGTKWVQLRMCLACGRVSCCNSSLERHAAKHFEQTGHEIMTDYPAKSWRWCFVDKNYV